MGFLIVFLGAGLGGAMRHGMNMAAAHQFGATFPYGTLIINVSGSFMMGLVVEYFALRGHLPQDWRLFLTTGVLGGFTTFSAYSLEAALLYERGQLASAAAYVVGSVILAIGALFAGLAITRGIGNL